MVGTLVNSTGDKNELPRQILSFNADKLFSRQNRKSLEESEVFLFCVYSTIFFGQCCVRDPQTLEFDRITERAC